MLNKIILATAANPPYMSKIMPYLNTIGQLSMATENRFYMVDATFNDYQKVSGIVYTNINPAQIQAPNDNTCIQHGEFLFFDDYNDDDIVIFTDGDIRLQRWFSLEEMELICKLKYKDILLARNAAMRLDPSEDTLKAEASRLGPQKPVDVIFDELGYAEEVKNLRCFNTGVVICRADTYKLWCLDYMHMFKKIKPYFWHYAVQQWLMCLIAETEFNAIEMSKAIHAHGHYQLPTGVAVSGGRWCYNGIPIMFSHRL